MYPQLPDTLVNNHGFAVLPDRRQVELHTTGYVEGDTNAFVGDQSKFYWADSGDELTLDDINSEVEHEGQKYFLHEYVWQFIKWED